MSHRLAVAVLSIALFAGQAHAEKNVEIAPVTAKVGKLLVDDSFERTDLAQPYATAKGEWRIDAGTVVGRELPADEHAAVLNVAHPNRDSIVRMSFQLKGTQGFHLSLNHAKGHLFRVIVDEKSVTLRTDKDKKNPESKGVTNARADAAFEHGTWYTMQVEIVGANVLVKTDTGVTIRAQNPAFAVEKPGYRFVTRGESLLLDDLKVWSVAE